MAAALAIAALVVMPWVRRGWLLLLDWTPGPHLPVPKSFWGLEGTHQAGLPFALLTLAVSKTAGAATTGWVLIAIAITLAVVSAGMLVGGSPVRRVAAGTLYAVNPLVFERVFAGHVAYLLAYALLPLVVASVVRWRDELSWRGMRPALWLAVVTALTSHFLWIVGVVLLAHLVVSGNRRCSLPWVGAVTGLTLLLSAYFIVPSLGRPEPVRVGESHLVAYRTQADPTLGLAVNVAGLYGFWRAEPTLPKQEIAGWPVFLGAIVLLAGFGIRRAWRSDDAGHLARIMTVAGPVGLFLAMGDQGPTGPVFRWLFDHLPGFAVMREPQKFACLLALAYAVGFAFAVEDFARRSVRNWSRLTASALAVAVPVLYTPTLFFGLAGASRVTTYPASWSAADRAMGPGNGRLLFLPWHQYMSFSFTGHVVANPADGFFRRETIVGDNVELSTVASDSTLRRSQYLEFLYAHGSELCAFGRLTAPLGVEYVALANTVDFASYRWLDDQVDLEVVLRGSDLTLYRNTGYRGLAVVGSAPVTVADWGELAGLANSGALNGAASVERPRPGTIPAGACGAAATRVARTADASRRSPVEYHLPGGPSGFLALAETFDPTWHLRGRQPTELGGGTVGFPVDGQPGTVSFGHWGRVRAAYLMSALAWAALLVANVLREMFGKRSDGVQVPELR